MDGRACQALTHSGCRYAAAMRPRWPYKIQSRTLVAVLCVGAGGLASAPQASASGKIKNCAPMTVPDGSGDGSGLRLYNIRRSSTLSCRSIRRLMTLVYSGKGTNPVGPGRPTYRYPGGWRCGTGAGGVSCWSVKSRKHNVIDDDTSQDKAITAWN